MNEISTWCLEQRNLLKLSQDSLAEKTGLSISTIRLVEGGGAISMTDLRKLAKVLPVTDSQRTRWCGASAK